MLWVFRGDPRYSDAMPCGGTIRSIAYPRAPRVSGAAGSAKGASCAADEQLAPFGTGELMKRAFLRVDAVWGIRPIRGTRPQTVSFPIPPPGHTVQRA